MQLVKSLLQQLRAGHCQVDIQILLDTRDIVSLLLDAYKMMNWHKQKTLKGKLDLTVVA